MKINRLTLAALTALLLIVPAARAADVAPEPIRVISTVFVPFDFTREIAGDLADLRMLLPPGSESHSYEPTPQDIIAIQNCDVFLYVGGESDAWVRDVLESMDQSHMRQVTLMDCVPILEEEIVAGMEAEEEGEAEEPEYDEHVWTSPKNAALIAQRIADALAEADPENAETYARNAAAFIEKLGALDAELEAVVSGGARRTIIFGDRFPFRYLADAYGLTYFAAFPGRATETEPSAQTVAFLIDEVREERIPVVFHIELSNEKMADAICEETGAKKLLLHACHNITKADFEGGASYLQLMEHNVAALREALS